MTNKNNCKYSMKEIKTEAKKSVAKQIYDKLESTRLTKAQRDVYNSTATSKERGFDSYIRGEALNNIGEIKRNSVYTNIARVARAILIGTGLYFVGRECMDGQRMIEMTGNLANDNFFPTALSIINTIAVGCAGTLVVDKFRDNVHKAKECAELCISHLSDVKNNIQNIIDERNEKAKRQQENEEKFAQFLDDTKDLGKKTKTEGLKGHNKEDENANYSKPSLSKKDESLREFHDKMDKWYSGDHKNDGM